MRDSVLAAGRVDDGSAGGEHGEGQRLPEVEKKTGDVILLRTKIDLLSRMSLRDTLI
jgi:hypothetical protein